MPRLKVMTLNVWGFRGDWAARRARLLKVMQDEELDVLLLQEADERAWHLNQAVELAQLTGYAMAFVPTQRYFPWPSVATGLAILSRFPISNPLATEIFPQNGLFPSGGNERRLAQRVEISLDGMSVVLYNTHLPLEEAHRLLAVHRLWTQVVQEEAVLVVLGGDFNATPAERTIRFLLGREIIDGMMGQMIDSWAQSGIGPEETFPAGQPRSRIDYIFYQAEPSVIVQEAKVVGRAPDEMSDHAAVVTTFAISPARDPVIPFDEEPVGSVHPVDRGGDDFFSR